MRTWKGVLTIRSPLSTSPAIRETDGAQSFSPEVAEVSRPTETHRAHLEGFQQPCSLAHSVCYPACLGQACPPDPTCCPLLPFVLEHPQTLQGTSHMPRHSMPLQHSMPLGRIIISFANPCPTFLGNFLNLQAQLLFHSLEALPDLLEAELSLSLDCPQHRGSHRMMVKRGLLNRGSAAY